GERVISVEEVAELSLGHGHWVALEARPPEAPIVDVLRGALRMRPDRLIVGEVHGPEAYELLLSAASAHDGTLFAVAAEGAGAARVAGAPGRVGRLAAGPAGAVRARGARGGAPGALGRRDPPRGVDRRGRRRRQRRAGRARAVPLPGAGRQVRRRRRGPALLRAADGARA